MGTQGDPQRAGRVLASFGYKVRENPPPLTSVVLKITYSHKSADWLGLPWQLGFTGGLLGGGTSPHMLILGPGGRDGSYPGCLGYVRSARQRGLLRLRFGTG